MTEIRGGSGPAVASRGSVPLPTAPVVHRPRAREIKRPPGWAAQPATRRRRSGGRLIVRVDRPVTPRLMTISERSADRYFAVIAAYQRGVLYEAIQREVGVTRSVIHRWVAHAAAGGLGPGEEETLAPVRALVLEAALVADEVVRTDVSVGALADEHDLRDEVVQRWINEEIGKRNQGGD